MSTQRIAGPTAFPSFPSNYSVATSGSDRIQACSLIAMSPVRTQGAPVYPPFPDDVHMRSHQKIKSELNKPVRSKSIHRKVLNYIKTIELSTLIKAFLATFTAFLFLGCLSRLLNF